MLNKATALYFLHNDSKNVRRSTSYIRNRPLFYLHNNKKVVGFTPLEITYMFYTYILRSKKGNKWYTGSTNNLQKRFKDHNLGKVASTENRAPFELIYYEACINEQDARQREKYLKSGMGKRYLKNRLKRFLSLTG